MGYGYWTRDSFERYSRERGRSLDAAGNLDRSLTDRQLFRQMSLHAQLDPVHVMRECCDSADHPRTLPVVLALDVTGSMGTAAAEVARKMNGVMTRLYRQIRDVEFMVMGIGDLSYDRAPIQISQFEADIRIAEQLDRIYLEYGGGGNAYESYTAAWYMGAFHTRLDCWKRGKKGLMITMGDEPLNPFLPREPLARVTGDVLQGDVETGPLYREAEKKYELYHLHVSHTRTDRYLEDVKESFGQVLDRGHLLITDPEHIAETLIRVITGHSEEKGRKNGFLREIAWGTGPAAGSAG